VSAALANYSEAIEQLSAGKLRALVSLSRERIAALPDVPSTTDVGFKDYSMEVWFGALAPAKTPKDVVTELATWIKAAIQAPDVKPRLAALGLYPIGTCLDDFAAYIRKQYDEEHKVLSQALRREPTDEEHRAHAHAFVDLVFDDQAKAGAAWAAAAATKIVRFVPPVRPRDPWIN
jgi:hypothetical protein